MGQDSIHSDLFQKDELRIVDFKPEYAKDFYELNIEWLKKFFYVEPFDEEVLSKPHIYITGRGGFIFFALLNEKITGTVALMPTDDPSILELTKMAVTPELRGKKIGQALMQYCIDFAKERHLKGLLIYSNTVLENAIYIYKKYGFKEIPLEANGPYQRGNIKLLLDFD